MRDRCVMMWPPRVFMPFPGRVTLGTGVVVGEYVVLLHVCVGVWVRWVVLCYGLLCYNFIGRGGGDQFPPFQSIVVDQVCHLGGKFLGAAFMQIFRMSRVLVSPLFVAPLGCGEGLSSVLRRVAYMR